MTRSAEGQFLSLALQGREPGDVAGLPEAASRVEDWPLVVELAGRHRVSAWLASAIAKAGVAVPAESLEALQLEAWARTVASLALDRELEGVLRALKLAEVPVMVMKGRAVAESLYPSPALRPYTDMDLLVPEGSRVRVDAVCRSLGYELEEDHGGQEAPRRDAGEHAFESLYIHSDTGLRLDIHFDHLQLGLRPVELSGVWQRRAPWLHQGAQAAVPATADLFLMLAVHLHRHGFERLIWLKDLDLLLRKYGDEMDWRQISHSAGVEGVCASVEQALLRLDRILKTPLPGAARRLARTRPATVLASWFWRDSHLYAPKARRGRWRRAVQFVPWDGVRGALPSLLLMGRRGDKAQALWHRLSSRAPSDLGRGARR